MNEERFRELARQAGVLIDWGEDIKVGRWGIGGNYKNMQKFAELIIAECMACSTWVGKMNTNSVEPVHTAHAINQRIKQHFGVEE
jgi:hypothetical protein